MSDLSRAVFPEDPQPAACLGWVVRDRRAALGLTQQEVAERSGLTTRSVGAIDRGLRSPVLPVLVRIARALETTHGALQEEVHQVLLRENAWYRAFMGDDPPDQ